MARPTHLQTFALQINHTSPSLARSYMKSVSDFDESAREKRNPSNTERRFSCQICHSIFVPGDNCSVRLKPSEYAKCPKSISKRGDRVVYVKLNPRGRRQKLEDIKGSGKSLNKVAYLCHVCNSLSLFAGSKRQDRIAALAVERPTSERKIVPAETATKPSVTTPHKATFAPNDILPATNRTSSVRQKDSLESKNPMKSRKPETKTAQLQPSAKVPIRSGSNSKMESKKMALKKVLSEKKKETPGSFSLTDFLL